MQPRPTSDMPSPPETALVPDAWAQHAAGRPRSQSEPRLGALAQIARRRQMPLVDAASIAAGPASEAESTFGAVLSEWEWAAPASCLPHERKHRREAAHRMRCLREDGTDCLDLDDLYLTSLPPCLVDLLSLKRLNVGFNNLETLPELPPGLTHLYVHGNRLKRLPRLPPTLEVLDAHNNQLSRLSAFPRGLTCLRVQANPIVYLSHVPEGLDKFSVDPGVLEATVRALAEKIVRLKAALPFPPQPTAPGVAQGNVGEEAAMLHAPLPSAAALTRLGPELIGAIATRLASAMVNAAHLSACSTDLHRVVQPDLDRRCIEAAQAQMVTLNRFRRVPADGNFSEAVI